LGCHGSALGVTDGLLGLQMASGAAGGFVGSWVAMGVADGLCGLMIWKILTNALNFRIKKVTEVGRKYWVFLNTRHYFMKWLILS
jgi:hypothetical protein